MPGRELAAFFLHETLVQPYTHDFPHLRQKLVLPDPEASTNLLYTHASGRAPSPGKYQLRGWYASLLCSPYLRSRLFAVGTARFFPVSQFFQF